MMPQMPSNLGVEWNAPGLNIIEETSTAECIRRVNDYNEKYNIDILTDQTKGGEAVTKQAFIQNVRTWVWQHKTSESDE